MILKRSFVLTFFMLFSIGILASDVPIIFVHGHKSEAIPLKWDNDKQQYVGGWTTWYPMKPDLSLKFPTAMTKIADSHYGGYHYGLKADGTSAITCDKTTQLQPNQGTKRIFNFSYYNPDGSRGVIGYSDSVLVLIKDDGSDTLFPYEPDYPKGKDVPAHYYQVWFPRYIPVSIYYMNTYIENWRSGKCHCLGACHCERIFLLVVVCGNLAFNVFRLCLC